MAIATQQQTAFEIAGLRVEPGTRVFDYLTVAHKPAMPLQLPLTVIHGAEPGPVLSIIAGVHACEYAGIVTCMRLGNEIDPQQLKGTLVLVPVVNVPAFETRTPFVNPIDGQNINRVFPGKKYGTVSEQIAYTIYNEVIKRADVFMDLHSGDLIEAIPPHTCCQRVGVAEVDAKSEALARLFEIDLLNFMGKGIDDLNATEDEQGTYFAGLQSGLTSVGNAALAGVPSVLIEAGGAGTLDPEVVAMEMRGIVNCMRYLGMLEGPVQDDIPHSACYGMYIMKSRYGGVFFPDVAVGDAVQVGDRIGEMQDIRGRTVATFTSPLTGVVLMMYTTPVRSSGETILILGKADAPAL
jgi:predicted deacylase